MNVKIAILNKYESSAEVFEALLGNTISANAESVVAMNVSEHPRTSDIVFVLTFDGPKVRKQTPCIMAWLQIDRVEELLNSTLEGIIANHGTAKFINLVPTSKSPRLLAAMIVEQAESVPAKFEVKTEERTQKQDEDQAPQPKSRRKRNPRVGNRAVDDS